MVFFSVVFIFAYLPIVLLGYYALPKKLALIYLFVMNLVFYGWGEPKYLALMLVSIALNYAAAIAIERAANKKPVLAASLAVNLALICFFKYTGLFASTLTAAAPGFISWLLKLPAFGFLDGATAPALPAGISFYTFQAMAYLVDVYRGGLKAERGVLKFSMFFSLFPQLIAGPIVLYRDVADQIDRRGISLAGADGGLRLFICGLSKKLLLANPMGKAWETFGAAPGQNGVAGAWFGLVAYAFHIYFDFGGYSDMAVGLGKMLGINFPVNFNYPYISKSITEFWRRWHMTLSSWFRDYVYIPLGGSRRGAARNIFNLAAVWFLTGLWHGASWNFALWGMYFAVILLAERYFILSAFDRLKLPFFMRRIYAFGLVVVGWGLFAMTDFSRMFSYVAELFGASRAPVGGGVFTPDAFRVAVAFLPTLLACAVASTPLPKLAWASVTEGRRRFRALETAGVFIAFIFCVAAVTAQGYNPFIYFRF